ncbi:MAG: hypothetical protein HRU02_01575, partial [Myxococcales bacterium]|nr:hypothetical protein [Myxococcales bacterium]
AARPPAEGDPAAISAALQAGGSTGQRFDFEIRVDGEPSRDPRLVEIVSNALARFEVGPSQAERPGSQRPARVIFELAAQGGELGLSARVQGPAGSFEGRVTQGWRLPGRGALLPPVIAIGVALLTRRALLSLFMGIYAGVLSLLAGTGSPWTLPFRALGDVVGVYLLRELTDSFRVELMGFIVALIALVGVMSRAGGVQGMLEGLQRFARSARSALLVTYGFGLSIFFDDYANCMLVGSSMRPLTDRLRVSREKLAYVVDSTAAPVAGVSLLSTWIAFQVSVFEPQLPAVGIEASGYEIFLRALPYRFYCWLTLCMVLLVVLGGRDFGPMARAESRARRLGQVLGPGARPPVSEALSRLEPEPGMPADWRLALLPLGVVVVGAFAGIFIDGGGLRALVSDASLSLPVLGEILLAGSGASPIFAGALLGLATAAFLAGSNATRLALLAAGSAVAWGFFAEWGTALRAASFAAVAALVGGLAGLGMPTTRRPHLSFRQLRGAGFSSAGTLGFAVILLFQAWMIGAVCEDLGTADYLVALLSDALPPTSLPVMLFLAAGLVAFSTGSSWSTMSILLPNVVGLAAALGASSWLGSEGMVVVCVGAVLEGAIFGDHCSPISDTTVLSSVASGSDHVDHVRTQAPYALVVGAVALGVGYLPLLWLPGWNPLASLVLGGLALAAVLWSFGRSAD